MNGSRLLRVGLGLPVFGIGLAFIVAEVLRIFRANEAAHVMHIAVGIVLMYIGGMIINSTLAESIADNLIENLSPFLDRLPGGRRKTDPPAPPEN